MKNGTFYERVYFQIGLHRVYYYYTILPYLHILVVTFANLLVQESVTALTF